MKVTSINGGSSTAINSLLAFGIVVYREKFYLTQSYQSLLKSINGSEKIHVYIYDNTDIEGWKIDIPQNIGNICLHYYHDERNPGVSVAYNYMASLASEEKLAWIVLLDQDTILPDGAVREYQSAIETQSNFPVKVPILIVEHKIFSPFRMILNRSFTLKRVPSRFLPMGKFQFVNSGMLIKISLFKEVGGYNEVVKLDFADFLFIKRLRQKIKDFEVLPFSCEHHFSHSEKNKTKALKRYSIFVNDLLNCPQNGLNDKVGYFIVGVFHLAKLSLRFKTADFLRVWLQQKKMAKTL